MTRGDIVVLLVIVAIALLAAPSAGALLAPAGETAVLRGPEGVTSVDLSIAGRHVVPGRVGRVVFEVEDGAIYAAAADCPDRLCVHMGSAAPGRPVVCAPNGVSATIEVAPERALDAVSR